MKMNLDNKTKRIWDDAPDCDCDVQDCVDNHKLCILCGGTMIYGAHKSVQPNSLYAWDVDHIQPASRNGKNNITNLQVVHVSCNQQKGNNY